MLSQFQILKNCDRIPHYSPIATFDFSGNVAAIFIRCETIGFQVGLLLCFSSMYSDKYDKCKSEVFIFVFDSD